MAIGEAQIRDWALLEESLTAKLSQARDQLMDDEMMSAFQILEQGSRAMEGIEDRTYDRNADRKAAAIALWAKTCLAHESAGAGDRDKALRVIDAALSGGPKAA